MPLEDGGMVEKGWRGLGIEDGIMREMKWVFSYVGVWGCGYDGEQGAQLVARGILQDLCVGEATGIGKTRIRIPFARRGQAGADGRGRSDRDDGRIRQEGR